MGGALGQHRRDQQRVQGPSEAGLMEASGGLGLEVTGLREGSHPREPGCLPVGVSPLSRTLQEGTLGAVGPQTQSSRLAWAVCGVWS